jgi:hypothetical protein
MLFSKFIKNVLLLVTFFINFLGEKHHEKSNKY